MLAHYNQQALALISSKPIGMLNPPSVVSSWAGTIRSYTSGSAITFSNIRYFHMYYTEIDFIATITQGLSTWQLEAVCRSPVASHFILQDAAPFNIRLTPRFTGSAYTIIG